MSFIRKNIGLARGFLTMKPIASKRFYFSIHERLYWSEAYQALNISARNLMMCFQAELRWSGKGKKRILPIMAKSHLAKQNSNSTSLVFLKLI